MPVPRLRIRTISSGRGASPLNCSTKPLAAVMCFVNHLSDHLAMQTLVIRFKTDQELCITFSFYH